MTHLYTRTVFFVHDVARACGHYTGPWGFALDWDSGDGVLQVSLMGCEIILNEAGDHTRARAGHGRVFIGLEDAQGEAVREHIISRRISTTRVHWGRPTLVLTDVDGNEIFLWFPNDDLSGMPQTFPSHDTATTHPGASHA